MTATTPISLSPPTRAPRPSPTSPTRSRRNTGSGSATPSPRAARPDTTTRRWGSPRAAPGSSSSAISASSGATSRRSEFTVVGVGDMSGDVFGNGMLMSRHLRLLGAFNHLHVFIDPAPDPAKSFAERQRLFHLPRSSWADYDRALISPGGGVFERSAKSIPISPEMKRAFGIEADHLTPAELIRKLLDRTGRSPVVRRDRNLCQGARREPHAEVGDRANDALRIDGDEVRAKVVGEGANLAVTAARARRLCARRRTHQHRRDRQFCRRRYLGP